MRQLPGEHGEGIPRTPSGASLRIDRLPSAKRKTNPSTPQPLCDSSLGSTGKVFPEPLRALRSGKTGGKSWTRILCKDRLLFTQFIHFQVFRANLARSLHQMLYFGGRNLTLRVLNLPFVERIGRWVCRSDYVNSLRALRQAQRPKDYRPLLQPVAVVRPVTELVVRPVTELVVRPVTELVEVHQPSK